MNTDIVLIIAGLMCIPAMTLFCYFFEDNKPADGWRGFWIWLKRGLWRMIFESGGTKCLVFLFCSLMTFSVSAVEAYLQMENDTFLKREDNDYTHGTMLEIIDDYRIHYKIQQTMYAPDDLRAEHHIPGDRPYAGLFIGGVGYEFQNNVESPWTHYGEFNFGMIGPAAMCKETQSMIHKLLGCREPQGWDDQIHNEFVVNAQWWTRYNYYLCDYVALVPKAGVAAGTIEDFAELGGDIKVGYHLRHEYGNSNIMFSQSPNKKGSWTDKLSCYAFAGASEKYVLYNHMLEGSLFNNKDKDIDVDIEPFVWEVRFGVALQYDRFYAGYCAIFRGDEFKHQPNPPDYGMIRIGWTF